MKKITLLLLMLLALPTQAMDTAGYFKIKTFWGWSGSSAAVLIQLENQNALCPNGYWINDTETANSKSLISIALSAYHAKTPVQIYANENSDLPHLSTKECEIKLIVLSN